jgi:hypothetical protein
MFLIIRDPRSYGKPGTRDVRLPVVQTGRKIDNNEVHCVKTSAHSSASMRGSGTIETRGVAGAVPTVSSVSQKDRKD